MTVDATVTLIKCDMREHLYISVVHRVGNHLFLCYLSIWVGNVQLDNENYANPGGMVTARIESCIISTGL